MSKYKYEEYWQMKLKPLIDSKQIYDSGVQCPECNENLWSLAPVGRDAMAKAMLTATSISKTDTVEATIIVDDLGNLMDIKTYMAICPNGHRHDL